MWNKKLDTLNKHLLGVMGLLLIYNMFYQTLAGTIVLMILFALIYFRMISKNQRARSRENQNYVYFLSKFKLPKFKKKEKSAYKMYKCEGCGQKLRVPKGRGKIVVTCPNCKMQFDSRS